MEISVECIISLGRIIRVPRHYRGSPDCGIHMKLKVLFCLKLLLFCGVGLLTGCQGSDNEHSIDGNVQADVPADIDWASGFRVGEKQDGESLYVTNSIDLDHREMKNFSFHYTQTKRVGEDGFFSLQYYFDSAENKATRFLEGFFLEGQTAVFDIDTEAWGLSGTEVSVSSFDLTNDGMVFLATDNDGFSEMDDGLSFNRVNLVYTDREGTLISLIELTDVLQGQGILQEVLAHGADIYLDGEGYLYLVTEENGRLLVLNADGSFAMQYICAAGESGWMETPFKDDKGRLVFPVSIDGENRVRFLGRVDDALKELAVFEDSRITKCYGMFGQYIYYVDSDVMLTRWNIETGVREEVMEMESLGISQALVPDTYMLLKGDGNIWLRICLDQEDYVLTLTDQKPEYSDPVQVSLVTDINEGSFLNTSIISFSRKNPQYTFILEQEAEHNESYRERIMADIMAGNGPDVLCVSAEDMEILAEAGAIVPIDELLSQDTLDAILPGVVEMGTWEGRLMGITPEAVAETLITRKDIWEEKSWTLDDVLELAKEQDGLEGIFLYPQSTMPVFNVLHNLIGRDLENTRFLDMENGISCFEREGFVQLLELVKSLAQEDGYADGKMKLEEGAYLAEYLFVSTPWSFYASLAKHGEQAHTIGFPTDSGSGNYISNRGLMVVNAKSENREAVSAFLEYLLSFENQSNLGGGTLSVRSDMADRSVEYVTWYDGSSMYIWKGNGWNRQLESLADGTTFTEEYNAFLQSCVPYKDISPIYNIVWEEASAFFSGDKDALTVAQAIDNRVQVYLDEAN